MESIKIKKFAKIRPSQSRRHAHGKRKTGRNKDTLLSNIYKNLPNGELLYPEDIVTEESMRSVSEEIIREKILLNTQDEIPHSVAITIDKYEENQDIDKIYATIYCEQKSQKGILIGKNGALERKRV